jgi:DNA segregation ATPase FtsK/SpoIIIE-like protein
LLVAGTTGSGKTTFLKSILEQIDLLPDDSLKLAIVDGKGEYDYVDLVRPQHFTPEFGDVLLGHTFATEVLKWIVEVEVVRRRDILRKYFSSHKDAPKAPRQAYIKAQQAGEEFPIAPIVVVIDEFAEIMLAAGATARAFEDLIQRVVQAGRSALVHLLLATQRPDANVLPGAIKANMPSRVALALPSHHDSMTVLNSTGAEELLGSGDLLYQASTGDKVRLQGYRPA